jgi:hypothetical protein
MYLLTSFLSSRAACSPGYPPNPYGSSQPPMHSLYPQQHHPNQQQQQQNPYGGGPNPLGQIGQMWGVNDATAQMGVQFGKSAIGAGQDYVEKTVSNLSPLESVSFQSSKNRGRARRNELKLILIMSAGSSLVTSPSPSSNTPLPSRTCTSSKSSASCSGLGDTASGVER